MDTQVKELLDGINEAIEVNRKAADEGRKEIEANSQHAIDDLTSQLKDLQTAINRQAAAQEKAEEKSGPSDHEKAFGEYIRLPQDAKASPEIEQFKALDTATSSAAGYLIPPSLDTQIVDLLREQSPMLGLASVKNVSSGVWTGNVKTAHAAASRIAETASRVNTGDAAWDQKTISAHEVYANPEVTLAMLEDSGINLESELSADVAGSISLLINGETITGAGALTCEGIQTAVGATGAHDTIESVDAGTPGTIASDDIVGLPFQVNPGYRANARFMMNRATLATVRKLKDDNDNYLFLQGTLSDPAILGTLVGYPVVENEDVADVGGGSPESYPIYFGDFRKGYLIVNRLGTSVLRNPYIKPGFVSYYTRRRIGGGVWDGLALRALKV